MTLGYIGPMINRIDEAFQNIQRANFLPDNVKDKAEWDTPLRIGFGQTNSQPSTVQLMLQWLDPRLGEKILDVGSGSGWTTALLSYLVGPTGMVYAVEQKPRLVTFGAQNCKQLGIRNVHFYKAGKEFGLPQNAPYDGILVSAAAIALPEELVGQLKIGGRMVIPIRNSVFIIDKTSDYDYVSQEHPGFAFVPLT